MTTDRVSVAAGSKNVRGRGRWERRSSRKECQESQRRTTAMNEDEMQLAQALAKMSGPRTPIQAKLKNKLQGFR